MTWTNIMYMQQKDIDRKVAFVKQLRGLDINATERQLLLTNEHKTI